MDSEKCPCMSGKAYAECCEPVIKGTRKAATPEELMRSRYSAYAKAEIDHLAFSAKLMTFECGIRFLTDYLNGDTYFKIAYPEHNLDRCHTQFALVADIERKLDQMQEIVARA